MEIIGNWFEIDGIPINCINFHQFPSIHFIIFHQFPINFHRFPSISINSYRFPSISNRFPIDIDFQSISIENYGIWFNLMEFNGKLMEFDWNWWKLMENWWEIDGKLMEIDGNWWKFIVNWLEIDWKLIWNWWNSHQLHQFPSIYSINFHQFPINSDRFPSISIISYRFLIDFQSISISNRFP